MAVQSGSREAGRTPSPGRGRARRRGDRAAGWFGHPEPADLRVVRYGACEFRAMDAAHNALEPVGYPQVAVDALRRDRGLGVAWQNIFCLDLDDLPADEAALVQHYRLDAAPDVVIVQVGAIYAITQVLGEREPVLRTRNALAARLSPGLARPAYRAIDTVLRRYGRPYRTLREDGQLTRFVRTVRESWPQATVVVELPYLACREGHWRLEGLEAVRDTLRRAAAEAGVEVVDHDGRLGRRPELRCRNGYNLNAQGSEIVGRHWAERLGGPVEA
jgi:hypothetical protein